MRFPFTFGCLIIARAILETQHMTMQNIVDPFFIGVILVIFVMMDMHDFTRRPK